MDKSVPVPEFIIEICQTFQKANYQLYLVGGSLRDLLLFKKMHDWDMTTNATPEEILTLFPNAFYDNTFGTVGIPITLESDQKIVVEVTTFRSESEYKDRRHPEKIAWGKTIEEDLQRRDFTINAMALSLDTINGDKTLDTAKIIDPHKGKDELEKREIKAVGDANSRFKEDALVFFEPFGLPQIGFTIEENMECAARRCSTLPTISTEQLTNS
jgi:tRNA nucleotidyltransferase/poly(A) polymerase